MRDEELIRRIRQGDRSSADILIERHYPAVLRYCFRHSPDRDRAEDLTQETFLRAFRDVSRYDERGKFRAYLYKIAYHLCVDESKRRRCCLPVEEQEVPETSEALSRLEERDEVERLLRCLSPPQREAVLMHYGEGLSFREISEITGVPVRTIQSRVRLAVIAMRKERL